LGVDVSRYQHGTSLDWSAVKADGVSFAFIKATEGSSYTNSYFASDWATTKSIGLNHGAYHFARPSIGSADSQARYFVSKVGLSNGVGDLPPVLDLEVNGGLSVSALQSWTATWLQTVQQLTGRTPIIYTGPSFWRTSMGNSTAFTAYPLWIANYGVTSPSIPGGWSTWTFWQGSSTGSVAGIGGNVDMNAFQGTLAQLNTLANRVTDTPPAVTQPPAGKYASSTSLAVSRTSVYAGQSVTLSGQVSSASGAGLPGRTMALYRLSAGSTSWTRLTTLSTNSAGQYAASFPVSAQSTFRAKFLGGPRYSSSTSPDRLVTIRPKTATAVSLSTDRSWVGSGGSVKLYGHLTTAAGAALTGRSVSMYARTAGSSEWTLVATGTSLAPTGWYQAYVHPRASTTYKAVYEGALRYTAATSNRVSVTVS
jgi:GH25 family lysozyme M1 (1,4-beta-N-acetylmuramidase)